MVKLTMIACITDGLPLAECLDGGYVKDVVFYKQQEKLLFKNISKGQHESSRLSTETGPYRSRSRYVFTFFAFSKMRIM
ncbi:hypothetical protein ACQJBY_055966 [Aegilops geniculata]